MWGFHYQMAAWTHHFTIKQGISVYTYVWMSSIAYLENCSSDLLHTWQVYCWGPKEVKCCITELWINQRPPLCAAARAALQGSADWVEHVFTYVGSGPFQDPWLIVKFTFAAGCWIYYSTTNSKTMNIIIIIIICSSSRSSSVFSCKSKLYVLWFQTT